MGKVRRYPLRKRIQDKKTNEVTIQSLVQKKRDIQMIMNEKGKWITTKQNAYHEKSLHMSNLDIMEQLPIISIDKPNSNLSPRINHLSCPYHDHIKTKICDNIRSNQEPKKKHLTIDIDLIQSTQNPTSPIVCKSKTIPTSVKGLTCDSPLQNFTASNTLSLASRLISPNFEYIIPFDTTLQIDNLQNINDNLIGNKIEHNKHNHHIEIEEQPIRTKRTRSTTRNFKAQKQKQRMKESLESRGRISKVYLEPDTHIIDLNIHAKEPWVLTKLPLDIYHRVIKTMEQERNPKMIKGSWTTREDALLLELVQKYGPQRWSFIASHLKGRVGKQCRERYLNHLDPKINKSEWKEDEDHTIVKMQANLGNKWAKISKSLVGRTPNAVKNHWNSTLSKRAESIRRKIGC